MTPRNLITTERLDERCTRSLERGKDIYQPLSDNEAETLRTRARNGERRPEGLSGLYMRAWIMGAAEAADKRNRRVA